MKNECEPNNGGPAFPRPGFLSAIETPEQIIAQYENKPEEGMSLRDYIAVMVLPTLIEGEEFHYEPPVKRVNPLTGEVTMCGHSAKEQLEGHRIDISFSAYAWADAMVFARSANKDQYYDSI